MKTILKKIIKLLSIFKNIQYFRSLLKYHVAATIEHEDLFRSLHIRTAVDIGANKGQFSVMLRHCFPKVKIFSFEPLPVPAKIFSKVFQNDKNTVLHNVAIGPKKGEAIMHVSESDDSSSLLPISDLQEKMFPGTGEVGVVTIDVAQLDCFLTMEDINSPALLKLDVQGFELDALRGCESLLSSFDLIYCECSFVELYSGQKMPSDIIAWLYKRGFTLTGAYNMSYDNKGLAIQADFMFMNNERS